MKLLRSGLPNTAARLSQARMTNACPRSTDSVSIVPLALTACASHRDLTFPGSGPTGGDRERASEAGRKGGSASYENERLST
jgi:hypothetical protein